MYLSNNPLTFKAAVNLHTSFWENNMNNLNFTILCADIAESYGVELCQAEAICTITGVKSIEEIDARYIGHFSVYNNLDELTHDIYELYCENIPFKIVHNLIISDEPLRKIEEVCDK